MKISKEIKELIFDKDCTITKEMLLGHYIKSLPIAEYETDETGYKKTLSLEIDYFNRNIDLRLDVIKDDMGGNIFFNDEISIEG